ncbi:MAG: sodium/proline symporter PutP, partial [Gammaproteobacteria bacterium]|nr:sodium/proline symporter PutP [Gammaproteobacteria bacterium]
MNTTLFSSPLVLVFLFYIVVVFVIGFYANRVTSNLSDYILGGRHLPGPVVALGAGASDMSSWLLLALPGAVLINGINQIWLPIGLSIGAYLNWQFVARRLRVYTEIANDSLTIPAYFDNRFQDKTRILRMVTAAVVLLFFTFYAAAGFVAAGYLVQALFGLAYIHALLIGSLVIIAYVCLGGFVAVSWIDFFQGTLMLIALIIVPIVTMHHLGGVQATLNDLAVKGQHYFDAFHGISLIGVVSLLAWGLGYFGQPQIIVRFMAARSKNAIPVAQLICMTWMILALYFAVFTGLSGQAFFAGKALQHPEMILIELAKILLNPWLAGLIVAGVLSSAMSATSAQLLSSASAASEDFYHLIFKKAKSKNLVWIARASVLVIGGIAIWIASRPGGNIFALVGYAWAGLGASFGPIVLISLYWKRMTTGGAIAGMIVGALTVLIWESLSKHGGMFSLYSLLPGFVFNSVAVYVVSRWLSKPVLAAVTTEFEKAERLLKT